MFALPRLLWLVALPLEAAAGWLVFGLGGLPAVVAGTATHILASVLFGVSLLSRRDGRWLLAWPLMGVTLSLVAFPAFGMVGMALAYVLAELSRPRDRALAEIAAAADPDDRPTDALGMAHELEVALVDELEIEPVVDVLRENDPELKRAAIEVIAKQGDTNAVRLMIGLLHDASPEARFFASLGLSKLEDAISRSILAAQKSLADAPDPAEAREHLAQLYLNYATSGFLEGVTREYYLDLARQTFEEALPGSADPDQVAMRLARAHLLLGNIAQAADLLEDLVRRRPLDDELHLLRMEVIYQFGDVRELSIYAQRALPSLPEEAEARELMEWWSGVDRREETLAG